MGKENYRVLQAYKAIFESKSILSELELVTLASTNYPNVNIDNDNTRHDKVNKPLLDDIQAAAKKAGVVVTITTASSGHPAKGQSRHSQQTAVDIAIINGRSSGGATGPSNGDRSFRLMGDKLKDALVSMGYTWNREIGNDKAVLWQTNTGGNHFNHLHISNKSSSSSSSSSSSDSRTNYVTDNQPKDDYDYTKVIGDVKEPVNPFEIKATGESPLIGNKELASFLTKKTPVTEGLFSSGDLYGDFGKNYSESGGVLTLPSSENRKIYSAVKGILEIRRVRGSCKNQISIKHMVNDKPYFLEYCGITNPKVGNRGKVSKGEVLGTTDDDVQVYLRDGSYNIVNIESFAAKASKNASQYNTDGDDSSKQSSTEKSYRATGERSHYNNELGYTLGSAFGKPVDWLFGKTEKKVNENIEKIKKLIK